MQTKIKNLNIAVYSKIKPRLKQGIYNVNLTLKVCMHTFGVKI